MTTGIVGERGQITIPKDIRNRLGLRPKTTVMLEVTPQGLLIHPTRTVALRGFPDEFIDELVAGDELQPGERDAIIAKWKK